MRALPKINMIYWLCLMCASVFGTNTGDFVSDTLNIGHLSGLPYLAGLFAIILVAERWGPFRSPLYFWAAIITVRTAATNVGDAFHDFHIEFMQSLPWTLGAFVAAVLIYQIVDGKRVKAEGGIPVTPLFWLCMILAGIVGTIGGDYASFGLHLMPPGTAAVFGAIAVVLLAIGRKPAATVPLFYWLLLALIRTGGTGGGDALAHLFGLVPSTEITGAVFVGLTVIAYAFFKGNRRSPVVVEGNIAPEGA